MDSNKRPDDMVRITTPELAQAFIDEQVAASPRADRRQEGAAGPFRRRRQLCRRGAAHQGHRQAAHLRAREPRPHAQGRERAGHRRVQEPDGREPGLRGRHRPLPGQARRRRASPRPSARSSAPSSSACSRRRPARSASEVRLPGAGHHLPRHPGVQGRREGAPQRGRPARGSAVRAVRARQAAVQGRGARGRPRARPAREHGRAPALPRPRPGRSLPRRHHPRSPGGAARGRRHRARGDRQRPA